MELTQAHKSKPGWDGIVRRKRASMRLTQVEFGKLFGVTREAVSQWETGATQPGPEVTWWFFRQEQVARIKAHQGRP